MLIDAFGNGATVGTPGLLALLHRVNDSDTPLKPGMVRPMATHDVLLRLQRNLVQRRLQAGDMQAALKALEGMLQIAPDTAANWLNAADLNYQPRPCRQGDRSPRAFPGAGAGE